ncbi:MAG: cyclic nucleotide-binding domain-containing protein [Deltaproteobacteria bacterium]|nr:cyclic nucleotide-binding domain-containing protein [Deltaproteobacteria bacterium]
MTSAGKEIAELFFYLEEYEVENLATYFSFGQVKAGEILWKEGDPCEALAFIVSGKIRLSKQTEFKGKEVVIGVFGPGSMAGELSILDGSPQATSAIALEDTVLLRLSKGSFGRILQESPELGMRLLKSMLLSVSARLKHALGRLAAIF